MQSLPAIYNFIKCGCRHTRVAQDIWSVNQKKIHVIRMQALKRCIDLTKQIFFR